MGRQFHFYTHTVASIPRTIRRYRKETIRLLAEVSMGTGALAVIGGTLVVVALLTTAVGYEVGQQGVTSLGRIGIGALSGFISAFFNTREAIPPVIAGIALTATVGAGFTAQLGAMRVSEEIDAMETMSIPSLPPTSSRRVSPRGIIAVIPLYAVALFVGYVATQLVTEFLGEASGTYQHYFNVFLVPSDVAWSMVKVVAMSVVVMCVHCYHGYNATGGPPAGVGVAVGRAVRTSLIAIMVIDLLIGIAVYGGSAGAVKVSG